MAEYMLLCKSVSGLGSVALKEVFCKSEMFSDTDSLHKFCVAYEVVCKGASRAKFGRKTVASPTAVTPLPDTPHEDRPPETARTGEIPI